MEACLRSSYTRGRPLEPLKLPSNLTKDVASDVHLGSHSAVHYRLTCWSTRGQSGGWGGPQSRRRRHSGTRSQPRPGQQAGSGYWRAGLGKYRLSNDFDDITM